MPLWLLVAGAVGLVLWWSNAPHTPSTEQQRARAWRAGGIAALFGLVLRLGPARFAGLIGSIITAWPLVQQAMRGLGWQATTSGAAPAPNARMNRAEAARLLDVAEGASREEVEASYRRLMARVHPDTGGSAYLAQLLNAARDTLLS